MRVLCVDKEPINKGGGGGKFGAVEAVCIWDEVSEVEFDGILERLFAASRAAWSCVCNCAISFSLLCIVSFS